MADAPAELDGFGEPTCEVCAQPMASGSTALPVGVCELPFHVHEACQERLGPLAAEITQMCSAAEERPDGLLWLGSWGSEPVPSERGADDAAA